MRIVAAIVARNLRLFFRDRLNVLFSLMSGLILFFLYTLFLARLQVDGLTASLPEASKSEIEAFIASWMLSGIVLLTTVTAGIGALSTLVDDRATGRFADFLVAPIRRTHLVLGYLLSSIVVAVVMSSIVFVLTVLYLGILHDIWMTPYEIIQALSVMVLCCAAFTSLAAFGASFLRTTGAYSAFATIVGTVLGFVAGAYIPVGSLPDGVASTINALPFAQGAMLMRRPYTEQAVQAVTGGDADSIDFLRTFYGIDVLVGDARVSAVVAIGVLVLMAIGFTALAAGRVRSLLR